MLGDAAVRRDDEHGREVALERAVEEREALDVEHVDLVDEEHARHDLGLALLAPLGDLGVDLLAHLGLDLAGVAREEREEALLPRVDHVDLVQADRCAPPPCASAARPRGTARSASRAHGVVVARRREGPAELGDACPTPCRS